MWLSSNGIVGYYVRFTLLLYHLLSLFQNEEILLLSSRKVRGSTPRLSTHTHTPSPFFLCVCAYSAARGLRGEAETKVFFFEKRNNFL